MARAIERPHAAMYTRALMRQCVGLAREADMHLIHWRAPQLRARGTIMAQVHAYVHHGVRDVTRTYTTSTTSTRCIRIRN